MRKSIPILTFLIFLCSEYGFCQPVTSDSMAAYPIGTRAVFKGKVFDKKTKEFLSAEITYRLVENEGESGKTFTDSITGEFKIAIRPDEDYSVIIKKNGYLNQEEIINSGLNVRSFYIERPIRICPVIIINSVEFNFNKTDFMQESLIDIQCVGEILKTNPELKVKLTGYTDNRGSVNYNLKISLKRALFVKEYITSLGIEGSRIVTEGLGEKNPVGSNDTEERRQKNRRVEFEIIQ